MGLYNSKNLNKSCDVLSFQVSKYPLLDIVHKDNSLIAYKLLCSFSNLLTNKIDVLSISRSHLLVVAIVVEQNQRLEARISLHEDLMCQIVLDVTLVLVTIHR